MGKKEKNLTIMLLFWS